MLALALDQPRINAAIWAFPRKPGDTPLAPPDFAGDPAINIQAFLDTGASGILFSEATAGRFQLARERFPASSDPVTFSDVGITGCRIQYLHAD